MNEEWPHLLQRLGLADPGDGQQLDAPLPGDGLCSLAPLALLSVAGEDAETVLQSQVTGDMRALADGQAQPVAHCSPKGRTLASFLALRAGDRLLLQLPEALADGIARRLQMFVLRARARVTRADASYLRLGLWGPAASGQVESLVGSAPAAPFQYLVADGGIALRLPGAVPRFELLLPAESAERAAKLAGGPSTPAPFAAWRLLDIRAGLPWVHAETAEAFIPQMLNLDRLGGISFTKGCYVGQEVVARLHYLGQVKRRTHLGTALLEGPAPAPGTPLFSPASTSRQGAGTVLDAVRLADGSCELLVVVESGAQAGQELHLGAEAGPAVQLRPPPYALADPEAKPARNPG
ncbi:MAG TPA: folate-binding protein [Gammaproteobacteria bacterium]